MITKRDMPEIFTAFFDNEHPMPRLLTMDEKMKHITKR